MNIRDFQYLVAVAQELHFGRAAERCHVSQPTLSMQLKKLEDTLGVQLFERTNKSVMLTPIGHDIAQRTAHILKEIDQIKALAAASKDPLAGQIRLGIFPTLAPYIMPGLMPLLRASFPKLNVLLVEEKTPVLITQLEKGEIDCAILATPVHAAGLHFDPLFEEPFLLAVAASHRLAGCKAVALADIQQESMLLLEDGHCLRDQALEVCSWAGTREANNFRATSLETLRHMVASGGSVTLIPKLAVRDDDTHVAYIPFKTHAPSRTLGLYARKTSARKPLFTAIASKVQEHYSAL
jgi:LysR family hydrogen peroxide-inducible transcriptional activator